MFSYVYKVLSTEAMPPSVSELCSLVWHDVLLIDMARVHQLLKALPDADLSRLDLESYWTAIEKLSTSLNLVSTFVAAKKSDLVAQYGWSEVESTSRDLMMAELLQVKLEMLLYIRLRGAAAKTSAGEQPLTSQLLDERLGATMMRFVGLLERTMVCLTETQDADKLLDVLRNSIAGIQHSKCCHHHICALPNTFQAVLQYCACGNPGPVRFLAQPPADPW